MISTKVLNPPPTFLPLANLVPVAFWCTGAYNAMVKNHMQKELHFWDSTPSVVATQQAHSKAKGKLGLSNY